MQPLRLHISMPMRPTELWNPERERERAYRDANGWSFDEVTHDLLDGFDRDGDGALTHVKFLGIKWSDETKRTERTRDWLDIGLRHGRPNVPVVQVQEYASYGLHALVRVADTDGDGMVNQTELQNAIRRYDANGDGRLSLAEYGRLDHEIGAELLRTWQQVTEVKLPGSKSSRR